VHYTDPKNLERLGISERSIRQYIADGVLPARKLGKFVFVQGSDLLNLPHMQQDHEPTSETTST